LPLDLEWPRQLRHRRGAPERLGGIDLYYDFEWGDHFRDGRAQFRHGQALAQFVRRTCPDAKTPAILLTADPDVEEGFSDTPLHRVCVLHLPSYRAAEADPFLAYLAGKLGEGITRIGPLGPEVAERVAAGAAVAASPIDVGQITAWAEKDPERLQALRDIAGGEGPADLGDVLAALAGLGEDLDSAAVASIAALFGPDTDRERCLELLREITADPGGRYLTGEVMLERVPQRIADARDALTAYRALLSDPASSETDLQNFIEKNLWLLGLEYVKARPRHPIVRGAADFILERVDGFHDLLELKSPQDPIITAPDDRDGKPPAAHDYALSPALANALAQAHVYRDTLTTDDRANERNFGLRDSRDPRLIVVIGVAAPIPDHRLRVLREMNKSLHRVEVVPYDVLGERSESALANVEKYLSVAEAETAVPDNIDNEADS
jgi:hypothetical protein